MGIYINIWLGNYTLYHAAEFKQRSTIPSRLGFSNAAATLSLSPSCLFTAASDEWDPGVTWRWKDEEHVMGRIILLIAKCEQEVAHLPEYQL